MPLFHALCGAHESRNAVRLSKRWIFGLRAAVGFSSALLLGAGCDGDDSFGPGGSGYSLGGACYNSYDCATGFCCTSPPCRHGMCTYPCRADPDCPVGTRCDAGACFWACAIDADCPWGQLCKKGHTVCQY